MPSSDRFPFYHRTRALNAKFDCLSTQGFKWIVDHSWEPAHLVGFYEVYASRPALAPAAFTRRQNGSLFMAARWVLLGPAATCLAAVELQMLEQALTFGYLGLRRSAAGPDEEQLVPMLTNAVSMLVTSIFISASCDVLRLTGDTELCQAIWPDADHRPAYYVPTTEALVSGAPPQHARQQIVVSRLAWKESPAGSKHFAALKYLELRKDRRDRKELKQQCPPKKPGGFLRRLLSRRNRPSKKN